VEGWPREGGFDVALAETAPDNVKGACVVGVVEKQELAAKAFVTDVVKGTIASDLPGSAGPVSIPAIPGSSVGFGTRCTIIDVAVKARTMTR